jgi:streptogramin lyase
VSSLSALAPAQTQYDCDFFVTEETPARVWTYHALSPAVTGLFTSAPANTPPVAFQAIHHGNTSQPVLVGSFGHGVFEFDRNTGALIKVYNPTGGYQWAGVFAPNGDVLIGDWSNDQIRRYNAVTGAYISTFATNVVDPADMLFGPNGNLFVCSYFSGVYELHGVTGALVAHHANTSPVIQRANDIIFLPDGRRIVTSSFISTLQAFVFDQNWNLLTTFAGTNWGRPHGIDISPIDGHIYVADGVTNAVHRFDPTTYVETHAAFVQLETKIVDVEFRRAAQPNCGRIIAIAPSCGGLAIEHTGRPQVGSMLTLRVTGTRPLVPVFCSIGDSSTQWNGLPLPFPLSGFGAPGCSVNTSPLVFLPTAADPTGTAQMPITLPRDPNLISAHVFFQWFVLDRQLNAFGLATSAGYDVRLGS